MISQVFTGSYKFLQGPSIHSWSCKVLKFLLSYIVLKDLSFCRVLLVFTRSCKLQILPQGFVSLQGLASSYKSYKVLQVVLSCCKSFKVCKVLHTIGRGVAPPCLYRLIVLVFLKQSLQSYNLQVSFYFDWHFIFEQEFLAISRIRSRALGLKGFLG